MLFVNFFYLGAKHFNNKQTLKLVNNKLKIKFYNSFFNSFIFRKK